MFLLNEYLLSTFSVLAMKTQKTTQSLLLGLPARWETSMEGKYGSV